MTTAFLDCFAGISGDMTLGALLDLGLSLKDLRSHLGRLKVGGFTVDAERVTKNGISGTRVIVKTEEQHAHRHLKHIREIIEGSDLSATVKRRSLAVFQTLAEAEARVHNTTPEKIHFHEVGALDAIVDIVGAAIGFELLRVDRIVVSPISLGTGFVDCQHGRIPVPAPATVEILRGVPVHHIGIPAELTTPTGAAIARTLADQFSSGPDFAPTRVGYGAGSRDLEIPNLLRIIIGEESRPAIGSDRVDQIEANIDDLPPEQYEYVMDTLFVEGALDVLLIPAIMKKSRPAVVLQVLAPTDRTEALLPIIFRETTTLGVRVRTVERRILPRSSHEVTTEVGKVRVKVARLDGRIRDFSPEYEDCRRVAREQNLPLRKVYELAVKAAADQIRE